jgi:N-formylglutamate amidohydrolase
MSEAVVVKRSENALRLPLVCDSPHSGTHYPADLRAALPLHLLRQTEDTDIDALWAATPQLGGTLVAACFPRCYIDPNRDLSDLDPALLEGKWPLPLSPGPKSKLGYGLIFSKVNDDTWIYNRPLSVHEVQQRIANYWQPYRDALDQEISSACQEFGGVWHLNLHSMPNNAYARLGLRSDKPLADFVLGDRDGSTCEPEFMQLIEDSLRCWGYSVARNDPYKGVALLAQIGQPALNRHSVQIEIRRPLYMNEATRERSEGFEPLRNHLSQMLRNVADYVRSRVNEAPTGL